VIYLCFFKKEVPKYLKYLLIVIAIPVLGSVISQVLGYRNDFIAIAFSPASFFLIGPLLYFYCESILCVNSKQSRWIHLIPFVIFTILLLFFNPIPPPIANQEMLEVLMKEKVKPILPKYLLSASITISNLFYGYLIVKLINKNNQDSKKYYSTQDYNITLKWLKWLVITFVVFSLLSALLKELIVANRSIIDFKYVNVIISIVFVYFLSAFGFQQKVLSELSVISSNDIAEEDKAPLDAIAIKEKHSGLAEKLDNYMKVEKAFLNENLRLSEVSKKMNVSTNDLSFFINNQHEKNFYKYVNEFRVQYACELLKNKEYNKYTVLAIAYEAGFNSKSTFNQVFKEIIKQTPTKFRSS